MLVLPQLGVLLPGQPAVRAGPEAPFRPLARGFAFLFAASFVAQLAFWRRHLALMDFEEPE